MSRSRSLTHRTTYLYSIRYPGEEERLHSYPLLKSRASSPTSRYNSFASFRTSPYCQEMSRQSYLTYPWSKWRVFFALIEKASLVPVAPPAMQPVAPDPPADHIPPDDKIIRTVFEKIQELADHRYGYVE